MSRFLVCFVNRLLRQRWHSFPLTYCSDAEKMVWIQKDPIRIKSSTCAGEWERCCRGSRSFDKSLNHIAGFLSTTEQRTCKIGKQILMSMFTKPATELCTTAGDWDSRTQFSITARADKSLCICTVLITAVGVVLACTEIIEMAGIHGGGATFVTALIFVVDEIFIVVLISFHSRNERCKFLRFFT